VYTDVIAAGAHQMRRRGVKMSSAIAWGSRYTAAWHSIHAR